MRKATLVSIISFLFLTACQQTIKEQPATVATYSTIDISTGSKTHAKYSYKGKSYQWAGAKIEVKDPNGQWQPPTFDYENFITNSIKTELTKHQLKESKAASDLIISYGIDLNMAAIRVKNYGDANSELIFQVPEGALTVIIASRKTGKILWTGWAKADYKELGQDTAKHRIEYSISEIFKRFPG